MKSKATKILIFLYCLTLGLSGCASLRGTDTRYYSAPLPKVWAAASSTLTEMGIEPRDKGHDYFGGLLRAKLYDRTSLAIELTRRTGDLTEVSVNIGTFGDQEKSEMIHSKISSKLNM